MKKISFIIYYPYQWFIYRNIYNLLPEDRREVILDLGVHKNLQNEEVEKNIKKLLARENVQYRALTNLDYLEEQIITFFSNVEVIVSCWESGCVVNPHIANIKKVGLTYGLAKELNMVRPARSVYDIVLAYGKRDQAFFSLLTKSVAIGNPRLDNFYTGSRQNSKEIGVIREFIDVKRKTILYVPTHGDLGSFKEMLGTFAKLSKSYNVIFKPHYYSLREDSEVIEKYRQIEDILVIDDTFDTVEVMAESDIIMSDNSSAIFDAMQVDKPIIVCDFLTTDFLDITHKNFRINKRGIVGANTYSASFEQEVKAKNLVALIKKPDELKSVLENIDKIDKQYRAGQRALVQEYFAYNDGEASKRAAEIIVDIYEKPRDHVQGILHHAYLAYGNRMYRSKDRILLQENAQSRDKHDTILWIFCDEWTETSAVLATINSCSGNKNIKQIVISGVKEESFPQIDSKIAFFDKHKEAVTYIYSECQHDTTLFFVKANTLLFRFNTAIDFKQASKRNIIFFAEELARPIDFTETESRTFMLSKQEILGFNSWSDDSFINVNREQLHGLEMAGIMLSTSTFLENEMPDSEIFSFNHMMSFFIMIDSLQSIDFAVMPNLFKNFEGYKKGKLFEKLLQRGLYLEGINISINKWPDKKIGSYVFKIVTGKVEYYYLLRLLILKIIRVFKYRINSFLQGVSTRLETKAKNLK